MLHIKAMEGRLVADIDAEITDWPYGSEVWNSSKRHLQAHQVFSRSNRGRGFIAVRISSDSCDDHGWMKVSQEYLKMEKSG
jgi:hypothetical protein